MRLRILTLIGRTQMQDRMFAPTIQRQVSNRSKCKNKLGFRNEVKTCQESKLRKTLALLNIWNTPPRGHSFSPAQRLMSRCPRSSMSESLWDMWSRTRLTMQLSGWMQTIRSHWRMSLLPKKCDGWNTTREHTGPHYVSPVHQRPTLSRPTLSWHLSRWHHSQFLIWRDRWTSWHHISSSTRPRWPFAEVGRQQDGHKCCQEEMSLSD